MSVNFERTFWSLQFFQKMNKNKSTWGIIVLKVKFLVRLLIQDNNKSFRNYLTFNLKLSITPFFGMEKFRNLKFCWWNFWQIHFCQNLTLLIWNYQISHSILFLEITKIHIFWEGLKLNMYDKTSQFIWHLLGVFCVPKK